MRLRWSNWVGFHSLPTIDGYEQCVLIQIWAGGGYVIAEVTQRDGHTITGTAIEGRNDAINRWRAAHEALEIALAAGILVS